jgi:hypothetical protein
MLYVVKIVTGKFFIKTYPQAFKFLATMKNKNLRRLYSGGGLFS